MYIYICILDIPCVYICIYIIYFILYTIYTKDSGLGRLEANTHNP